MQHRVYIIAFVILALTAAAAVPPANAEPLTIMAIVGVVTVLSVSSIDMVARSDDDKEMHAQQEEGAQLLAKAEAGTTAAAAEAATVATP